MSGVGEAAAVFGLITSSIAVIQASKQLLDAAKDAKGLPKALRVLHTQLPLIETTLTNIKSHSGTASDEDCAPLAQAAKSCDENAEELGKLLKEVTTGDKDGIAKRYWKHVQAVTGKGHKAELLAQEVIRQLQLFQANHVFANVATKDDLQVAISQLDKVDEEDGTYISYGSGPINVANAGSEQTNHNYSGTFSATGNMHIGPVYQGQQPLPILAKCLQSLAFPGHRRRQDIKSKTDGTCEWIFTHEQYLKWEDTGGILLIQGRPGTGKSTLMDSMLTAALANEYSTDDLEKSTSGMTRGTFVASFFFHRRGVPLQYSALGLFRSILHQLLSNDQELLTSFATITRFADRLYQEGEPGPDKNWDWRESDLQDFLTKNLQSFLQHHRIRLFIDALDESGELHAREIWRHLKDLRDYSGDQMSICVSCRPYPDVDFQPNFYIAIEDETEPDIATYLRTVLETELRWHSAADQKAIESALQDQASGVFQWVVLVGSRVLEMHGESKDFMLAEIVRIPLELSDLYQDMFQSFTRNVMEAKQALRILRWITFGTRPLTLEELRYAVAIDPDLPLWSHQPYQASVHWCDSDEIMAARIKRLSRGLVKVLQNPSANKSQAVQFDHESVKEYMIGNGLRFLETVAGQQAFSSGLSARANLTLCKACIQRVGTPDAESVSNCDELPFLEYAVFAWVDHACAVEDLPVGKMLIELTQWPLNRFWVLQERLATNLATGKPLTTLQHRAATYNLAGILNDVLEQGMVKRLNASDDDLRATRGGLDSIDAVDNFNETPLWIAAQEGGLRTVTYLCSTGMVDVNHINIQGNTPIGVAAEHGHKDIVMALLETGKVDISLPTKLHVAARSGLEVLVATLLTDGALDPDCRDVDGRTALRLAAGVGRERVVQTLLLTGRVDIDAMDKDGVTPLAAAVYSHRTDVVKMLLATRKAEVNFRDQSCQTLLHRAVRRRFKDIIEALVAADGIDIGATNLEGWTPLELAVTDDYSSGVEIFLATGKVNVNFQYRDGNTLLHLAAMHGSTRVMATLLAQDGVEVNTRDSYDRTPLHVATEYGYEGEVQMLLDTGKANRDARDVYDDTPLLLAQYMRRDNIADTLISYCP